MTKVSRAGKQTLAFWAAIARSEAKWEDEKYDGIPADTPYLKSKERAQGFATGWMKGVAWAKRNWKPKK